MRLESRPYASLADLREMQAAITSAWLSPRRPLLPQTIGDLAWWFAGAGPDADWPARIRIWTDGTRTVGWGWFNPPASFDWFVAPLGEADERRIRLEIVAWAGERVAMHAASRDDAAASAVPSPELWGADGWPETDALADLGFAASGHAMTQYHQRLDRDLPGPALPAGYTLRTVAGPSEIPARVEVHRSAFAPSKMTVEKYSILVGLWPYAYDLDAVVEAPDGSFAAFTMCWLDREAGVGYFEPVGVHADHRRRGLGKAVNTFGLRLLQAAGARDALVYSDASNAASEALYRSVGFRPIAVHRSFARRSGG
ncbi:MAG TPA: GNAT family N-acetyltransferase [Candidatus Limnocylindrales bacterium]|nr:GNAT family N-acetyltransferase [Candidatus Limnocylindrales bacterium]